MALPNFQKFYNDIMNFLADEKEHSAKEILDCCIKMQHISEEDQQLMNNNGVNKLYNRVQWAITYLRQAGLIISNRGIHRISDEGIKLVKTNVAIDNNYLRNYPSFLDFESRHKSESNSKEPVASITNDTDNTPEERIEDAIEEINNKIEKDLLDRIVKIDPYKFEDLVCKLFVKMGYGTYTPTKKSGDQGIDGILNVDKFGFEKIYVQAKKWDLDSTIGAPEIRKFAGAISQAANGTQKGIFVTTSRFTTEAEESVDKFSNQQIVLIDGHKLAQLMIEYNVGVQGNGQKYYIKSIDNDFFDELII